MRRMIKSSAKYLLIAMSISAFPVLADAIAVTGAKIHTMTSVGTIDEGTVLIKDGKIQQVIEGKSVPSGFTEFDAAGKVITPGLIGAYTQLGLEEVSLSAGTVDARADQHPISTVGAAYDTQFAINADSSIIPISRVEGFTSAATTLSSSEMLFQGQGSIITLDDGFDSVIKPQAFMSIDVSNGGADENGGSRAALWVALNSVFEEAQFARGLDLSPTEDWNGLSTKQDVAALRKVINGDMPLLVSADRASDIQQVVKLKDRFTDLNIVLVSGTDAWRIADKLAQSDIPVILNPEYNLPGGFDQLGATLENAARLHKAGVMVAIGMETHNIRLATQHAGNAVANGLPHSIGLAALTINPAKIFGMDKEIGSLASGKRADLVVWSGDPLEVTQTAEQVFIHGKAIEMTSRQIKLRDRYLNRDKAKPVAYTRP
ncbi:amidohydrolase family protein [Glaciecola sp. KUL10]|uniref:amidohydrolase family protein n=1 Tax=Glaciecola sp. (strain KUL10) TaxID=2161813 RepID=UPI000D913B21|nr:amidohydrolase family protein [Glaciecola sp. KUL10]GBL05529.1 amidohydrolase [Glaciecola sp. KUL10]